jgi:predicted transcriptional regulator
MPRDTPIRDVMTRKVVLMQANVEVHEAAKVLQENGISGAPVVDRDGRFIGMIEDEDLIATEANLHVPTVINLLGVDFALPWDNMRFKEEFRKAVSTTVGELMKKEFPKVTEEVTLGEVATLMRDEDVNRVVVVAEDNHVIGIVARSDLVRALAREA